MNNFGALQIYTSLFGHVICTSVNKDHHWMVLNQPII